MRNITFSMILKMTLRIVILTYVFPLWAKIPLIRGIHADKSEYLAYIKTHGEYEEYHQTEMNRSLPNAEQVKNLRLYLQRAQESYLSNNIGSAKTHFKEVTDLAFTTDWEPEHRLAIYYSFLRRAQMEEVSENQNQLITQALEFDPQLKPDPKLFSQRIQLEFGRIKEKYQWLSWSPKELFEKYDVIKINGKVIPHLRREISVSHGLLRVSLFSDSFQRQNVKIRGKDLITWEPRHRPLSHGDCMDGESFNSLIPVYFSKHCIYEQPKELLKPLSAYSHHSQKMVKTSKFRFLKSKWFWVGVGVVTFAIVSQSREGGKKPHRPSSHRGF